MYSSVRQTVSLLKTSNDDDDDDDDDDDNAAADVVSRYNVGIALSCMLLVLVTFMYLALCFGACGESAGEGAGLCNRGTGACLLLMYVCLTCIARSVAM